MAVERNLHWTCINTMLLHWVSWPWSYMGDSPMCTNINVCPPSANVFIGEIYIYSNQKGACKSLLFSACSLILKYVNWYSTHINTIVLKCWYQIQYSQKHCYTDHWYVSKSLREKSEVQNYILLICWETFFPMMLLYVTEKRKTKSS